MSDFHRTIAMYLSINFLLVASAGLFALGYFLRIRLRVQIPFRGLTRVAQFICLCSLVLPIFRDVMEKSLAHLKLKPDIP